MPSSAAGRRQLNLASVHREVRVMKKLISAIFSDNYMTVNNVDQFGRRVLFPSPNVPHFEISLQFGLVFNWFLLAFSIV